MATILSTSIFSNRDTYLDAAGRPLALGRLEIYMPDSSTALAHVYNDAALTAPLPNPVILDSAGRAPELYSATGVYVRVERFMGKNEYGENLYEFVYGYKTPPGIDISSFWNCNFVDTYLQLSTEITNESPTFVLKEGDPHLYTWNPKKPSSAGLDGVIDIASEANPEGSWHWETKRIYADQARIKNNEGDYDTAQWSVLAMLGQKGYDIIIPAGIYDLFGKNLGSLTFQKLEISPGVSFVNGNMVIEVTKDVSCLSKSLPILWTLPGYKQYDTSYFNQNIGAEPVDIVVTTPEFGFARIRNCQLAISNSKNKMLPCRIGEILPMPDGGGTLEFTGTCGKARVSNLPDSIVSSLSQTSLLESIDWLLVDKNLALYANLSINRMSVLPGGSVGAQMPYSILTVNDLVSCVPNAINCRIAVNSKAGTNAYNLDPNILDQGGVRNTLSYAENWKAKGLGNLNAGTVTEFTAQNNQSFTDCDFSGATITVNDGIEVSFVNCKIGTLQPRGAPKLTCIGCHISTIRYLGNPYGAPDYPSIDLSTILLIKCKINKVDTPPQQVASYSKNPVIIENAVAPTMAGFSLLPIEEAYSEGIIGGISPTRNAVFYTGIKIRPIAWLNSSSSGILIPVSLDSYPMQNVSSSLAVNMKAARLLIIDSFHPDSYYLSAPARSSNVPGDRLTYQDWYDSGFSSFTAIIPEMFFL